MSAAGPQASAGFEWAVAARPLDGGPRCGDQHLCAPFPGGLLVAVVDGLGHGEGAEQAARIAIEALAQAPQAPLEALIRRCHQAMRGSRGAVMTLAALTSPGELTWAGVGNVEGVLVRRRPEGRKVAHSVTLRGGVVGYQLPPIRTVSHPLEGGELLILATDGVRSDFTRDLGEEDAPALLAEGLLARHARATDDALVVVVRVPEPPGTASASAEGSAGGGRS